MQSADPSTLFQSDASLAIGQSRALKASKTSTGSAWGSPIWLGHKHEDVEKLASGGAGADGGPGKVLGMEVDQERQLVWTAESGGSVRGVCLETLRNRLIDYFRKIKNGKEERISTGDCRYLFRGHTAPASCLAVYQTPSGRSILISGSWDKSIRFWPLPTSSNNESSTASNLDPIRIKPIAILPNAGSDFIKSIHVLDSSRGASSETLLSGGSDRVVRAWDMKILSLYVDGLQENAWRKAGNGEEVKLETPPAPVMMATMREHTRPLSALTSLPPQPNSTSNSDPSTVFSADSMGRIFEMRLHITRSDKPPSARFEMRRELKGNETGVFALWAGWKRRFDEDAEEDENGNVKEEWQAEVWTGSHDKTAREFDLAAENQKVPVSVSTSTSTKYATVGSQIPLYPIRSISHPDYVKALLPLSHLFSTLSSQPQGSETSNALKASSLVPDVLLSGSTDEQLRVWDLTSKASAEELAAEREKASKLRSLNGQANDADESGTVLISLVEGHWHEISSIDIWWRIRTGELESDRKTREDEESRKKGETRVGEGINKMTVTKEKGSLEGGGEWWIVTSSLDGSIRRWKLSELLIPKPISTSFESQTAESLPAGVPQQKEKKSTSSSAMTEDEERELAELMEDDD